jgi:hypothetical protein
VLTAGDAVCLSTTRTQHQKRRCHHVTKAVSRIVYAITPNLWRREIRWGGALFHCGTAPTRVAAEKDVNHFINT